MKKSDFFSLFLIILNKLVFVKMKMKYFMKRFMQKILYEINKIAN